MRIVIDVEANSLFSPTKIWCVVCKDMDTGKRKIFRNLTDDVEQTRSLEEVLREASKVVGHNILGYDVPVLDNLLSIRISLDKVVDTLVVSKLVDYSRKSGHSIESYGEEFGLEKIDVGPSVKGHNPFFDQWSQEMEDYCVRDVDIGHRVYLTLEPYILSDVWARSIALEQSFQLVVNSLRNNGFAFNTLRAESLLGKVTSELAILDKEIHDAFPPRLRQVREIVPRLTKFGTLNRSDFRWVKGDDLSPYNGGPFSRCVWEDFNPSSHKQIVEVLTGAGWRPTDRTKTHQDLEKEVSRQKYLPEEKRTLDLTTVSAKILVLQKYGWKINEENLSTLPPTAPAPARLLAKRILLESRRRTLTEWLGLVQDGRIHGDFYGIGAWTHRMAHQKPNTANIPNEFDTSGKKKLLGKELRSLWRAPRKRVLVGVDAEGIQLRIFAHYVDDKELTQSLVDGRKDNKTDPHSLNQRVLGSICKSRAAAKRFLYALLLGGGIGKFGEILECSREEAEDAVNKFNKRYPGFDLLKRERFPSDAQRGFFIGLDGRRVRIPGDTVGQRRHLAMSGYLQNGEAIVMKMATLKWINKLNGYNSILVNFVHDEWQTETPNDMAIALQVAELQANSLRSVGEELGLKCPLAGSYWNEDLKDYTIGVNWSVTH